MSALIWSIDICSRCSVVKLCRWHVCDVAESVPLGPGLRIQSINIVVGEGGDERLDVMLEGLALEAWNLWLVEWQAVDTLVMLRKEVELSGRHT